MYNMKYDISHRIQIRHNVYLPLSDGVPEMRIFVAILLFFTLSFHSVMKLSVIATFELNRADIIERYCVNKDKPKLSCNGNCYLQKQLDKLDQTQHQQDDKTVPVVKLNIEPSDIILYEAFGFDLHLYVIEKATSHYDKYQEDENSRYIKGIFHPPRVIAS